MKTAVAAMERFFLAMWYGRSRWPLVFLPLSGVFCLSARLRRLAYLRGWRRVEHLPVPVIVVGNLTVGGTGKTPLVLWLAEGLRRRGRRPGLVSRGYGGSGTGQPVLVDRDADAGKVGDEALLLARHSGCPVAVGTDRVAAARLLLRGRRDDRHHRCDCIISDDGLQHYRLGRDLEVVVVDAQRGLGNGHCLPAGPLREPPGRLGEVDVQVNHGAAGADTMHLEPSAAINLADPSRSRSLGEFASGPVHGVAGIGNPQRFFATLRDAGLEVIPHPFPDHWPYSAHDLDFDDGFPVLMTEKDGVKWAKFATSRYWVVPVRTVLGETLAQRLWSGCGRIFDSTTTAHDNG